MTEFTVTQLNALDELTKAAKKMHDAFPNYIGLVAFSRAGKKVVPYPRFKEGALATEAADTMADMSVCLHNTRVDLLKQIKEKESKAAPMSVVKGGKGGNNK